MRTALRGRGARHDDAVHEDPAVPRPRPGRRAEPAHRALRDQPRPLG